jgi:hypothetical protein
MTFCVVVWGIQSLVAGTGTSCDCNRTIHAALLVGSPMPCSAHVKRLRSPLLSPESRATLASGPTNKPLLCVCCKLSAGGTGTDGGQAATAHPVAAAAGEVGPLGRSLLQSCEKYCTGLNYPPGELGAGTVTASVVQWVTLHPTRV